MIFQPINTTAACPPARIPPCTPHPVCTRHTFCPGLGWEIWLLHHSPTGSPSPATQSQTKHEVHFKCWAAHYCSRPYLAFDVLMSVLPPQRQDKIRLHYMLHIHTTWAVTLSWTQSAAKHEVQRGKTTQEDEFTNNNYNSHKHGLHSIKVKAILTLNRINYACLCHC